MVDITNDDPLADLFDHPLLEAIYGSAYRWLPTDGAVAAGCQASCRP